MSRAFVMAAAVIGLSAGPFSRSSAAQEPVKAYLVGDPEPGRKAPVFKLPYFTADGPGPVDQPFTLEAELGRVVVLAFCRGVSDSAAATLLRNLSTRYDSLFAGDVAVAALVAAGSASVAAAAQGNSLRVKLLSDSASRIRRQYGIERNQIGVYVIGQDGRVTWRDLRFNPFLATGYDRLSQAVQDAARRR